MEQLTGLTGRKHMHAGSFKIKIATINLMTKNILDNQI